MNRNIFKPQRAWKLKILTICTGLEINCIRHKVKSQEKMSKHNLNLFFLSWLCSVPWLWKHFVIFFLSRLIKIRVHSFSAVFFSPFRLIFRSFFIGKVNILNFRTKTVEWFFPRWILSFSNLNHMQKFVSSFLTFISTPTSIPKNISVFRLFLVQQQIC